MSEVTERSGSEPARREQDGNSQTVLRPAVDIFERADGITLLLDMPGVSKDRLQIHSDRNSLVVEGEVEISMPEDTESLYADVRSTRYRRSFSLSGEQLDTGQVQATLKDGLLEINIAKRPELQSRKIEVQTG